MGEEEREETVLLMREPGDGYFARRQSVERWY